MEEMRKIKNVSFPAMIVKENKRIYAVLFLYFLFTLIPSELIPPLLC